MAEVKKITVSFGMSSKWQRDVYHWAKDQCGDNESAWLKSVLYHLYLEWKEEQGKEQG